MYRALSPVGFLSICLLATAATVQAESYLGSGASDDQIKRALLNTRTLTRQRSEAPSAPKGQAQPQKRADAAAPSAKSDSAKQHGAPEGRVAAAPPQQEAQASTGDEAAGPASFQIFFDLDSAALRKDAYPILDRLGAALSAPELKDFRFVVEGHTDALGSEQHNLELSENRAKSVREYLVEKHHVDPARLEAMGRGETELYEPDRPTSAKNRRVRFVNADSGS